MPTLRSKTDRSAEAGFEFHSELPVRSRRSMFAFIRRAMPLKASLDALAADDGGILAYEFVADLRRKRLTVASWWRDEEAFRRWVGGEPHRSAMTALRAGVDGATFRSGPVVRTATSASSTDAASS